MTDYRARFERVLSGEVPGDIVVGDCLDVIRPLHSCHKCRFWGSDAGYGDKWWCVCDHPQFEFPGRILPPSCVLEAPPWCPLFTGEEKEWNNS